MLALHTAYKSETGNRPRNEDSCGYWASGREGCWVVSDGAGGHGSGDKASQLVVGTTLNLFTTQPGVSDQKTIFLLESAHQAVMAAKQANPGGDDMHATAAVLLIDADQQKAVWGHVGDTRIYLFRDGKVAYQTRDHSLVQTMIDAGYGTTDMIRGHPQRSLLTAAIGNAGDLELRISGQPVAIADKDIFLICTDGWWEYVQESEMESLLQLQQQNDSLENWLSDMARLVEERAGVHSDNYTAVAVRAGDDDSVTTVIRGNTL